MKRLLKFLAYTILSIVVLCFVVLMVGLLYERWDLRYLRLKSFEPHTFDSYILKNVKVIPMTSDTILDNMSVYIENGKIKSISPTELNVTDDIYDCKGQYLMPGLNDMHVHVWDEYELGLYLANGVTGVRNLWGLPMHLRMKNAILNKKILGPHFLTTGPKLTGSEFIGSDNLQLFSPQEGKDKVNDYHDRGYDYIKTYYGLEQEVFDAIIEECEKLDMDIIAHPSQKVDYAFHFNEQIKSVEHAEDIVQQALNYKLDTLGLEQLIEKMQGIPHLSFCPTLIVYYNIYKILNNEDILDDPSLQFMNPLIRMVDSQSQIDRWHSSMARNAAIKKQIRDQHEFHMFAIRKLYESGVNLISGSDAGIGVTTPGFSLIEELKLYGEAGLNNYEALQTATVNVSKVHDEFEDYGSIEVGKVANLLLLESNPLDNLEALENPVYVIVNGVMVDRNRQKKFKEKATSRKNLIATGIRYLENEIIEK